jgi:hypothetical protein
MDHHQDIIDLIKSTPAALPPEDFTLRVMAAAAQPPEARDGIYARAWRSLTTSREFTLNPIRALHRGMSSEERGLYFMLVAFAHLVLFAVLLAGLRKTGPGTLTSPLILLQPWISLSLAAWLGVWGYLLRKNGEATVRGAKYATFVYIETVVINGALLILAFKPVLLLIPFFAGVAGLSIAAGIFLAFTCSPENRRVTQRPLALI